MIRKLTEQDRAEVLSLAGKEAALNLFLIADVENFGFGQEFQDLWGEFGPDRRLTAVLLRYERSYIPYAEGSFDAAGFAEIMLKDPEMAMMSGGGQLVEPFQSLIPFRKQKKMFFAELRQIRDASGLKEDGYSVRRATPMDVEGICRLTDLIEEFEVDPESSRSSLTRTLETGTGRTYFVEHEGKVIATASSTAENSMSAMVVSVATHPDYRGRGLASKAVTRLCADLVNEGKSLCLFYDNPDAASIYKRIGFQDIGSWIMNYR